VIILANDKRILGKFKNGRATNLLAGAVFVFLTGVTMIFLASIFLPGLFG